MSPKWINAVALATLIVSGATAVAQTARMDAPAAPPATERRPTLDLPDVYVDDADPAHPIVVKFAVDKDDYTANVCSGDDVVIISGTRKDGVLSGYIAGGKGGTKNFTAPMNGRTLDLPLFGAVRHLKRADPNVATLAARPGAAAVAVGEVSVDGWRLGRPDGWSVQPQPGGITVTSPDGGAGFGLYYLADPGTTDAVVVVNQLLKQNGATQVVEVARQSTLGEHASQLAIDLTYTNRGGAARHLHAEVTTHVGAGASRATWVGVADATPEAWAAQGTALVPLAGRIRPADPVVVAVDNPLAAQPKDAYVGTFSDGDLTVTLAPDGGRTAGRYAGTIVRGSRRFTLAVTRGADGLTGTFSDEAGHAFPATATVDAAGIITLRTGGATYTLKP